MSPQAIIAPTPPVAPPASLPAFSAPKMSVEDYLELERNSEVRHEYVRGEVIEMAGESLPHNRVAGNFYTFLDRFCEVYIEGVRLRVSPSQYRYPDVVALSGEPITDDGNPPCLLNPSVIIEVLSPSTQTTDRGDKLFEYQQIPTLTDYVMVAQQKVLVTHCVRLTLAEWKLTHYTHLDDILTFESLGVTMTLRDVYRKTALIAPPEPDAIPSA